MKNSKLVLYFGGTLILLLFFQVVMAQTGPADAPTLSFFEKIKLWITDQGTGMIAGIIASIMVKKGWTLIIKRIANKGALITKELGELMADSSVLLSVVDKSIKEDGSLEENSVKEMLAAGKEVVSELKDVTISIKPK